MRSGLVEQPGPSICPVVDELCEPDGPLMPITPVQPGGQAPQSAGQPVQLSPGPQAPLGQQGPQSVGQVAHDSPPWQVASPHTPQPPQSLGHVAQVSPPLHEPSPQLAEHWPHSLHASGQQSPNPTHAGSHQQPAGACVPHAPEAQPQS